MFCPKCSTANPFDTDYCRQCGFSLAIVQAALDGQIQESIEKFEASRKPLKVGAILLSIFSLVGFFTILSAIVSGTFSVGMLAVFIPSLIFGLPFIVFGTIRSGRALNAMKEQIRFDPSAKNQIKNEVTKLLEVPLGVIPITPISVTENTTRNLKIPKERA